MPPATPSLPAFPDHAALTRDRGRLLRLPRRYKRLLLVCNDFAILTFALWGAWSLRINALYVPPDAGFALILAAAPVIGVMCGDGRSSVVAGSMTSAKPFGCSGPNRFFVNESTRKSPTFAS